ncbi:MAG: GTP 3',8-cyclase MoaA [Eubacteriales bacterium]|nr:GTP 3',8-cyclase MoaA [Eubacteriales bacterium]
MRDSYKREINYMRISITDRCNLRCKYCMPEGIRLVSMEEILTFEEIEQICRAAVRTGITRFKITGGEPLVRLGCPELIGMIKGIPGVEQVTLTTNGVLLGQYLERLMENGLDGVNVSLDTLKPSVYEQITGYDKLAEVRESIRRAVDIGLAVKINSVLQQGIDMEEWEALAALTLEERVDVRFIEMMPIGYGKCRQGISGEEVLHRLTEQYPGIERDTSVHGNGPAVYYRIPGAPGSVGFISAVHGRFCDSCNRIRLTAKGELKPCLCYGDSINVRDIIRRMAERGGEEALLQNTEKAIREAIMRKPRMHCFDMCENMTESRQMVQIGG